MKITILVTGGTFDKEYDELNGKLFFKETHVHEMLELGRCTVKVDIFQLMMLDSLEMIDEDRDRILDYCRKCEAERIIITHGTDTMETTARILGQAKLNKTIVLTGAMIPYKFGSSDGLFNLGSAFAFVQTLPHGVYVAINGRYFDWHRAHKNKETGVFEETEGD